MENALPLRNQTLPERILSPERDAGHERIARRGCQATERPEHASDGRPDANVSCDQGRGENSRDHDAKQTQLSAFSIQLSEFCRSHATLCALMSSQDSSEQPIPQAHFHIRKASASDHAIILQLAHVLELTYPAMDLSRFWVVESDGAIVGIAELKDLETCSLLSCVGVREELQGRGIGRVLVDRVSREAHFPVYLYTLVPEFFRKAGFRDPLSLPPDLPPRAMYGCSTCNPELCLCLMRPCENS